MESLNVNWKITNHSNNSHRVYVWEDQLLESSHLEKNLGWPDGTISVLTKAFQTKLDRNVTWDLSQIVDAKPYKTAACYYKRGVSYNNQELSNSSGEYEIVITNTQPDLASYDLIIADQKVIKLWGLTNNSNILGVESSELNKSLETVASLVPRMRNMAKSADIAILGGGVISDSAAFACSIAQRNFTLIPTTLLAMVDACVGGKTGVNFQPFGKNQIGSFCFPKSVICWSGWLRTLDKRDFLSGLAEVVKHSILSGQISLSSDFQNPNSPTFNRALHQAIKVKSNIIARDATEKGERTILNLGHTLAHGFEYIAHKYSRHPIRHGEAVGLGILYAIIVSKSLKLLSNHEFEIIRQELERLNLIMSYEHLQAKLGVTSISNQSFIEELHSSLTHDKKNYGHEIRWVLLEGIGKVYNSDGSYTKAISHKQFLKSYGEFLDFLPQE